MAIIKCKMCGGDIELAENKTCGMCEYCGSIMTLPKISDEQRAAAFNRGNHFRRLGEFDKALTVYERIVAEDDTDAEAHWCCALCRFGIEYVEDPVTYEWLPTCHRASFDSFLEDVDYLAALEHSDGIARRQYQKDAAKIAEVQRGILATSQNTEPYDVFISYKELDNDGNRTRDSILAQDIYYQLTEKGWRVFFSRISLEDVPGTQYEPYIFAALNSAKVMIVVGTSAENLNTVWVKNEWSRYLAMMRKDRNKLLIPCYRDMNPYDLPEQLSVLMSYDMGKIGFIQDLIRGVDKVLNAGKKEPESVKETVKETVSVRQGSDGPNVSALLKRGRQALEDGEWNKARSFFDRVLNMDAENAGAFLGLFLVEKRRPDLENYVKDAVRLNPKPDYISLERDGQHIDAKITELTVPGYCDADEIKALYDFDAGYETKAGSVKETAAKIKASFRADRNLTRAFRYAQGETKQKLDASKKDLFDALDELAAAAEAETEAAKARAAEGYADRLREADQNAGRKSLAAREKREADYQEAAAQFSAAADLSEYTAVKQRFLDLQDYKDSPAMAGRCTEEITKLEKAAAEEAERKRKEKAAESERQRLLAEKAAKEKKAKRIKIGIIAGVIAVLALAVILLETKKQNYKKMHDYGNAGVGDVVSFGSYEQDNNTDNGKEEIEWLVLAKEDNRILVISRYALDCQPYNTEGTAVFWETCSLRAWLNGSFLSEAFSAEEQAVIPTATVPADWNPKYRINPGIDTEDRVFLLSISEADEYFVSNKDRGCNPTAYAKAKGSKVISAFGNSCRWWLRSPGSRADSAAFVTIIGGVFRKGDAVSVNDTVVRPALWIRLDS